MMGLGIRGAVGLASVVMAVMARPGGGQNVPLPTDVPVWLVGHPELSGSVLRPYERVRFSMARVGKEGPLGVGETVEERAYALHSLRREQVDGSDVWVRSVETWVPGREAPVAEAEIVLDGHTLAPMKATIRRGGGETVQEYDWDQHVVRHRNSSGDAPPDEALDLMALEAGAHETWMAALPWREGLRVMLPTVLAGGGGKWWAVPRVLGTEHMDLGDGVRREAWVVAIDWWGMGKDHSTYTPGDGANGTAGTGGKYWILREPVDGLPRVVRIRTEVDDSSDNVQQIQEGIPG